jgi:hypothetical protein
VANDSFGNPILSFWSDHFLIFKTYNIENLIFLEIVSFLKEEGRFGYPLEIWPRGLICVRLQSILGLGQM